LRRLCTSNGTVSVLTKNASAEVEISLRAAGLAGSAAKARPIPLEAFSTNKEMGRILIRRGGETIGAGETQLHSCFMNNAHCKLGIVLAILQ
jgi:translation elongation factor EF-1alpha